jgi:hypothetical protein
MVYEYKFVQVSGCMPREVLMKTEVLKINEYATRGWELFLISPLDGTPWLRRKIDEAKKCQCDNPPRKSTLSREDIEAITGLMNLLDSEIFWGDLSRNRKIQDVKEMLNGILKRHGLA